MQLFSFYAHDQILYVHDLNFIPSKSCFYFWDLTSPLKLVMPLTNKRLIKTKFL